MNNNETFHNDIFDFIEDFCTKEQEKKEPVKISSNWISVSTARIVRSSTCSCGASYELPEPELFIEEINKKTNAKRLFPIPPNSPQISKLPHEIYYLHKELKNCHKCQFTSKIIYNDQIPEVYNSIVKEKKEKDNEFTKEDLTCILDDLQLDNSGEAPFFDYEV